MGTQRRLMILALGFVCVAAIAIPAARLGSQWMAISELERDTVYMQINPSFVSDWTEAEWAEKLFGTVYAVELEGLASVRDAKNLRSLRGLQVLNFDGAPDDAWPLLPTQLKVLQLTRDGNGLSATALNQLAEMRLLATLSLHGGPPCDDALVKALERLPRLKGLEFDGITVPPAQLRRLLVDHPQLEGFAVCGTASLTDADIKLICGHRHISKLSLQENVKLTQTCLQFLVEMDSLQVLLLDLQGDHDVVREWFREHRPGLYVNETAKH